jgi:hypothetical protein
MPLLFFDLIEDSMNENTEPMAHEEAEKSNLVESYLLNELTEEQRARFEEHYFECTICADAVVAGQTFVRGIRPAEPWWKRFEERLNAPVSIPIWRLLAMGGAVAASLAFVGVQLHNPSAPLAVANTNILAKEEKSAADDNVYRLTTPSVTVEVDPYGTDPFPFYRMIISRNSSDIVSQVLPAPEKRTSRKLSLQVPAKALGSGFFSVTLVGLERADANERKPLAVYHFSTVQAD